MSNGYHYIYRKFPSGVRGRSVYLYLYFNPTGHMSWGADILKANPFVTLEAAQKALRAAKIELEGQGSQPRILKPGEVLK